VFRDDGLVYMVLEYGDIDLARLLQSHEEARRRGAGGEQQAEAEAPPSMAQVG
jgi:serine/threonine-protein kinase TTK/MPS1